jgi:leader peptidase (prepilin peptidase)/N-methyltransferase
MGILSSITLSSAFGGLLMASLVVLAYVDARWMILPDGLNMLLALAGLRQSLALDLSELAAAGLGAMFGSSVFALVGKAFRPFRGYDGMALGDMKFAGAAGFWIGWRGIR